MNTNLDLLNKAVDESGLKKIFIAKGIGISRQTLASKLDGKSDITVDEAAKISLILGLSKKQRGAIFVI